MLLALNIITIMCVYALDHFAVKLALHLLNGRFAFFENSIELTSKRKILTNEKLNKKIYVFDATVVFYFYSNSCHLYLQVIRFVCHALTYLL